MNINFEIITVVMVCSLIFFTFMLNLWSIVKKYRDNKRKNDDIIRINDIVKYDTTDNTKMYFTVEEVIGNEIVLSTVLLKDELEKQKDK